MERLSSRDRFGSGVIACPGNNDILKPVGVWDFLAVDKNGDPIWFERFQNLVTNAGKNALLDTMFNAASQVTWYMGLVSGGSTPSYAAGDTMSSHAGWTEVYSEYSQSNRPTWDPAAAASQQLSNSTPIDFSITATVTVAGGFIVSNNTKNGTTGTLFSVGSFSANRSLSNGDTLKVTYTLGF